MIFGTTLKATHTRQRCVSCCCMHFTDCTDDVDVCVRVRAYIFSQPSSDSRQMHKLCTTSGPSLQENTSIKKSRRKESAKGRVLRFVQCVPDDLPYTAYYCDYVWNFLISFGSWTVLVGEGLKYLVAGYFQYAPKGFFSKHDTHPWERKHNNTVPVTCTVCGMLYTTWQTTLVRRTISSSSSNGRVYVSYKIPFSHSFCRPCALCVVA